MEPAKLLEILHTAEKLKTTYRHSVTENGRRESVAEHSWRLAFFALLTADEFPELDMGKVLKMCVLHDLGECFTGDIPAFEKNDAHREREERELYAWLDGFPEPQRSEFTALFDEMRERKTGEAKLYKALDNLEAVVQHDEAPLSSWLPLEYELQLTYGADKVGHSPYLTTLKDEIDRMTREKIESGK